MPRFNSQILLFQNDNLSMKLFIPARIRVARDFGANISLNDYKKPNCLPTEKQRMIYVALSHPEVLACVAVPNSISNSDIVKVLGWQKN